MFFEGDVRSGIALAIKQSKSVACFVTDGDTESTTWESDYLQIPDVKALLLEKCILLRLEAGSQGAKDLSAICPLPKIPTFVVIYNGQLKDYITAGISKEEFWKRLRVALRDEHSASTQNPQADPLTEREEADTSATTPLDRATEGSPDAALNGSSNPPQNEPRSQVVDDLLEERRIRMEAQRKKEKDAAKADRAAKARSKREELEKATSSESRNSAEVNYELLRMKRQQEARDERERILKRIEDDKAERRARESRRKEQVRTTADSEEKQSEPLSSSNRSLRASTDTACALQVRLFDGSTIRSKFSSQSTLHGDVRPWIDSVFKGDIPYNFKHILTPQPNHTISMSEEGHSLYSLGLVPNATLVLIPIKDYTSAYDNGATSLITRGISYGYGVVTAGVGLLGTSLTSILGSRTNPQQGEQSQESQDSASIDSSGTVRTFRTHERPEDNQFYNGNALNFEPRRKEEEEDTEHDE